MYGCGWNILVNKRRSRKELWVEHLVADLGGCIKYSNVSFYIFFIIFNVINEAKCIYLHITYIYNCQILSLWIYHVTWICSWLCLDFLNQVYFKTQEMFDAIWDFKRKSISSLQMACYFLHLHDETRSNIWYIVKNSGLVPSVPYMVCQYLMANKTSCYGHMLAYFSLPWYVQIQF